MGGEGGIVQSHTSCHLMASTREGKSGIAVKSSHRLKRPHEEGGGGGGGGGGS